jgi:hypothetical protein
MDFDQLLKVLSALHLERVDYILVGGIALGLHGLIRATEDVDLFVDGDADNIERLRRALRSVWDDAEIDQITATDLAGEYPVIRYGPPEGGFAIDIMTRLGTRATYHDLAWQEMEVEGITARVATAQTLYELKRDTVRPIDRADADALRKRFNLQDD